MYRETAILRSPVTGEALSDPSVPLRHDLTGLIRNMKLSNAWARGDLNSMILVKNTERNVMLVALHGGTEIVSYQSNDSITFQIIEGKMKFNAGKTSTAIGMGQVLTLSDKVKYRLITCEETVLLMSIAKDNARNGLGRSENKAARNEFWR